MLDTQDYVILVDGNDRQIGTAEKLAAHRSGQLHRAFSVMIWDRHGRLLLQKRQHGKYHSGGLWTNSCCGHPRPGEDAGVAAERRLQEEMGFACSLKLLGPFTYRAELNNGLIEHEFVHIFRGQYDGPVRAEPAECDGFSWATPALIVDDVALAPDRFSAWFKKYVSAGWPIAAPPEPAAIAVR